jgi:hypothetical protein
MVPKYDERGGRDNPSEAGPFVEELRYISNNHAFETAKTHIHATRGCRVASATDPQGRISAF